MPLPPAPFTADLAPLDKLGSADDALRSLIHLSLNGVILYSPLYDAAGELVDFKFDYLNPAAQRMMRMPARPTLTHMEQWPQSKEHGTFQFHVEAYVTGEPREYNVNYQADGYDNYYRLAALRSGDSLLVNFTDTADQPRSPVEIALREAQARTEQQRAQLENLFLQSPAALCRLQGPDLVYALVNPGYQQLFPGRPLLGLPLLTALPELRGHTLWDTLQQVYRTGETHVDQSVRIPLARTTGGPLEDLYLTYILQADTDAAGQPLGVLVYAFDVTEQVLASLELESRVQIRTQEAEDARADAEEQRNRLERLFTQAPALINIFTGPEHIMTLVHPSTAQLLQNRPLLGLPRRQALPELGESHHEPLDRVYRSGEPYRAQEVHYRLDLLNNGVLHDRYMDLTYQPLFDAAGQVEGVMSLAIDVTERVRTYQRAEVLQAELLEAAQRQVRERETFYEVFAQTPASIALLRGAEHRFEYLNAAYQQLFPGRDLLGHPLAEVLPDAAAQGFLDLLNGVYRTGETFFGTELPLVIEQPGGRPPLETFFTFTYQAYRERGEVVGISIFAYDVTERVRGRQQREAQQQQLHDLFMQAPAPICILDGPELVFQLVNPAYQRIFPGRELLGKPLLKALPELAGTAVPGLLKQVYDTAETYVAQELPLMLARHEGAPLEEIYWTFTYQARRDAQGVIDGVLAFAYDVTAQVQARRVVEEGGQQALALATELAASNDQLMRTNVDLDTFIYTASHDLKAPISNIEGLLQALRAELPPQHQTQEVPYILDLMLDSVERFKKTISHLTEVSKLQKSQDEPASQVPLAPVIEDVRLDLLPLLGQTGGRLKVDVQDVATVTFSAKNLRSVVYNLVSNAFKYHHPERPPLVWVRARTEGRFVVLEVEDNGLGFEVDREEQLFAMFQRLHTHVEGSGVGLYMVKRMVENAGGKITVRSQLHEGSTFTIYMQR